MRNMFPNNSSEWSWLWNNSEPCLVRIHRPSAKQKQWKHQQAALNVPLRLSDRRPQYLKSGGDLSTARRHVTPCSYDSIHTHPGRAPSAPGASGAVWEYYSGSDASFPWARCMSKPHLSEGFIPPWRTILLLLFFFKKKGQKTECDDCQLFCGRIKTLSSLSHGARHLVLAAPQPFSFNCPLSVLTFRRVTVGFVHVPNISLGCVSVNSCLQIQTSRDLQFFFLAKSLVAHDLKQERQN